MLLKLQKYDLNIVFKKGKDMFLADTLSRSFLQDGAETDENRDYEVMQVEMQLPHPNRTAPYSDSSDEGSVKVIFNYHSGNWPVKFGSTPSW